MSRLPISKIVWKTYRNYLVVLCTRDVWKEQRLIFWFWYIKDKKKPLLRQIISLTMEIILIRCKTKKQTNNLSGHLFLICPIWRCINIYCGEKRTTIFALTAFLSSLLCCFHTYLHFSFLPSFLFSLYFSSFFLLLPSFLLSFLFFLSSFLSSFNILIFPFFYVLASFFLIQFLSSFSSFFFLFLLSSLFPFSLPFYILSSVFH